MHFHSGFYYTRKRKSREKGREYRSHHYLENHHRAHAIELLAKAEREFPLRHVIWSA
jgi:hypothetical protein